MAALRPLFIILASLSSVVVLNAQSQYMALGYQHSWINLPGINRSIHTYNTGNQRDSQVAIKPLSAFKSLGGVAFGFGSFSGTAGFDFSFHLARSLKEGNAPDFNGTQQYRNLLLREQTGAAAFYRVLEFRRLAVVLGLRGEAGWLRYYYRGWADGQPIPEKQRIRAHFTSRFGPSTMMMYRFGQFGLQIAAYRVWALTNSNSTLLDQKLNLSNFNGKSEPRFDNRTHMTAVQLKLLFYIDNK